MSEESKWMKSLENGDPIIKKFCQNWEKCLDQHWDEFEGFENNLEAEWSLVSNSCCGCIHCVLLRDQVDCGDSCYIREQYPQYQDDQGMFQLATGFDPEEIYKEYLEIYGVEPSEEAIFEIGLKQIQEKKDKLRKVMKGEALR